MSKKAHYNPKSLTWIISVVVMIVLSVGVIFGTYAIDNAVNGKNNEPVAIDFTIEKTEETAVQTNEYDVTSVEKAFDKNGNVVAYVISSSVIGYNQEVPIEMTTTITADAGVVCGIEILKQEETEYLGVRIMEEGFKNQFNGKRLPLKSKADITKGTSIDLIARSTVSSQAVLDGVNNAQKYVQEFLV